MSDPRWTSPLDGELYELGRWLDVPSEGEAVPAAVRARLEQGGAAAPGTSGARRHGWTWRAAAVLAVVIALAAAVVAASPPVRAALLEVLRIGSVRVHEGPAPPSGQSSLPEQPGMDATTLAAARRSAAFRVLVPTGRFADPDDVLAEPGPRRTYVALRYRPGPGRPPAGPSGVAVQIDEIAGDSTRFLDKYLDRAAARSVQVGDAPGVWIDGPHELIVADRSGAVRFEPARLSARTLVWQRDGVTLRLEGDLSLPEAVAVATSMR
jgi:hypothetical protein